MNIVTITNKKSGKQRIMYHKGTIAQGIDRITGYLQGVYDAGAKLDDYTVEHKFINQKGNERDCTHSIGHYYHGVHLPYSQLDRHLEEKN